MLPRASAINQSNNNARHSILILFLMFNGAILHCYATSKLITFLLINGERYTYYLILVPINQCLSVNIRINRMAYLYILSGF